MNRLNDLKMILENAGVQCITDAKTYTEQKDRYNAVMEYVNSLEQNEPIGKWIPCKERMPVLDVKDKMNDIKSFYETEGCILPFDIGKRFLVTSEDGRVHESVFWLIAKTFDDVIVKAWMPLPEPYKGE